MASHSAEAAVSERIHKVLARAGLGSRRAVERMLAAGSVRLNGGTAEVGAALDRGDRVEVNGRRYRVVSDRPRPARWLRYHKPAGQVSSRSDPEGRPTVFDGLPRLGAVRGRWVSLGRLDVNTTGLMLFTDDGDLANALTHPSAEVEREYAVRVDGHVEADTLERLTRGVLLDDGEARFERVVDAGGEGRNHWYHVILREGRRNEVRRIWEAVGCRVARLTRVRFGPVGLPRCLRPGRFEDLTRDEIRALGALVPGAANRGGLMLEPETRPRRRGGRERRKPAGEARAMAGAGGRRRG